MTSSSAYISSMIRLDHRVQEVLAAGNVPVEGHRLDAQLAPQPTHRQTGQAVLVDEAHRGVDDQVPVQGLPIGGRRPARDELGIGVIDVLVPLHEASSRGGQHRQTDEGGVS